MPWSRGAHLLRDPSEHPRASAAGRQDLARRDARLGDLPRLFPAQLPIFAAIAALLVVQPSVNQSLGKAVERSSGVLLGVLLAYGFSLLFENHGWVVLVAIVASILLGALLEDLRRVREEIIGTETT